MLIKGDVEKMRAEIKQEDRRQFDVDSKIYSVLFFVTLVTPIPLLYYLDYVGIGIWGVIG